MVETAKAVPEVPELPSRTNDRSEYTALIRLINSIEVTEENMRKNMKTTTSVKDGTTIYFAGSVLARLENRKHEALKRLEELQDV